MHHAALDRARAHDRDLDDEVVEARGLQPRQHRHLRARLDLEHADRVGALASSRRPRDPRPECPASRSARPRQRDTMSSARRIADSMPSARHVDLEQAQRVEVVLVPLDDRAVGHRRVLDRHHALEQAARDHEAADVLRQVARKADQLAGRARSSARDHADCRDRSPLRGCARRRSSRPSHHANMLGEPVDLREVEARAPCRRRAPRSSAGR